MKNLCTDSTLSFVSPGDDFDSEDLVKSYTIKYSKYASNLTEVGTSYNFCPFVINILMC